MDVSKQLEAGLLVGGPFGEEPADFAVQVLLERPGLGEVVVGLAERHGAHDRAACRVVPLHQQHPLGQRVHLTGPGEEVDAGHLAHAMVDDEQRHRFVPVGQPPQRRQPCGRPRLTDTRKSPPNRRLRSSRSAPITPVSS
jgi:hypothetical protein